MKRVFVRGSAETYANYDAALKASGLEPVFSLDLTLAAGCDGLLLTGGYDIDPSFYGQENHACFHVDPVRDQEEIGLVHEFMALGRPIFGICRGHQILNVALGGDMIQHVPGHAQLDTGVDDIHPVTAEHDFMRRLYGDRFAVNSAHHQLVGRLGQGLEVTCRSDEGYIEGILHENGRVFGVQFHPERIGFAKRREEAVDGALLFEVFRKLLEGTE
ncbi:MAG: gamma-glutamyl-gamma-aminobutyrate hydrolase family protein [Oscillospiraceae bacterium]|nr:gamma-glutamyl-gamma-aminobutyrate hydrolase family protein [Oscillospiraceae bacterium]